MLKITEIKGASLLPVEKDYPRRDPNGIEAPYVQGFNSAVTQLEHCSVEVDVEKFAKELFEICEYPNPEKWEETEEWNRQVWITRASIISMCKQNWLRLEVGNDV